MSPLQVSTILERPTVVRSLSKMLVVVGLGIYIYVILCVSIFSISLVEKWINEKSSYRLNFDWIVNDRCIVE